MNKKVLNIFLLLFFFIFFFSKFGIVVFIIEFFIFFVVIFGWFISNKFSVSFVIWKWFYRVIMDIVI